MRLRIGIAAMVAAAGLAVAPVRAVAIETSEGGSVAAATAEAVRIGQRDPAAEAAARMKIAEKLMVSDPAAAAAMVEGARAASLRAEGADGPMVALADYRLALLRALGGDRVNQLRPMAAAAQRIAAAARTPEHRTLAGQALIVGASFTMGSGEPALTAQLRDAGIAMLRRDDLAQTVDLAEAFRATADVLLFQNDPHAALPWTDRAIALYERIDPQNTALVYALARRGGTYQRLSRYTEALVDLRRAVVHSDLETDDPTVPIFALRSLGNYYARLAEPDLALPLFKRALMLAEKLPPGFPYSGGISRDIMQTLFDADRPEEARSYAEETAKRTLATMGASSYEHASALVVLARIDIAEGAFDDAARRIAQADAVFASGVGRENSRRFEPVAAHAALLAATDRPGEAAARYDAARAMIAHLPPDDVDRIDLAAGSAAARLAGGAATPATWTIARSAADGLTTRILRQVAGIGAIDTAKGRQDRVFGTALDAAWARAGGRAAARR